jgi:hypothetical protein
MIKLLNSVVLVASICVNVYLFRRSITGAEMKAMREAQRDGDAALDQRIDALATAKTDIDKRLSVLETRVEALPTHGDLTEIRGALTEITGELSANTERTSATLDTVRTIQRILMEHRT